ncbi:MAG: PD-(D/E)XK nuclease family protein, partial [bacterium]
MNNLETINQLLNEVQTISESYDRVAEATGENFNIFSVLKMETNEVATHSRFIAELLNPKGDHGQNDEFLKLFIKKFSDLEFNTSNAKVKPEHTIENGRIDIFLKDNFQNIIIIENKIHAGEQEDQLLRYSQAFPKKLYNREIFYLTLYGEQSKVDSSANIEYQIISYDNDIIKWLEECKEKAV